MSEQRYDIYFKGDILPNFEPEKVKAAIGNLFKSDAAGIEKLFSGKVNPVKLNIDKATAIKYQKAFASAGAKALITAAKNTQTTPAAQAASTANTQEPATPQATIQPATQTEKPSGSWDIAPTGSDLLKANERKKEVTSNIDTSSFNLSSVAPLDLGHQKDKSTLENVAVDEFAVAQMDIAELGADIDPNKKAEAQAPNVDFSQFDLAEVGSQMSDKKESAPVATPDISHLSLSD